MSLVLPSTSKQSLVEIGTPKNGFSRSNSCSVYFPDSIKASASAASFLAASKRLSTTQFNNEFTSSIRDINDSKT